MSVMGLFCLEILKPEKKGKNVKQERKY